ncbi:MAG TPA: serine hydrolase [Lacunisphaera sp.]|nr:serine hydrolase [Lacunisphaera sp.]
MKTDRFARLFALLLWAVLPASAKPPGDIQNRLNEWTKGQPGGVALAWVDADGSAFFQVGRFDTADPRPITPDTQFEIGSVTKVFTSLLLAESELRGKVSRDDPAAKYLLPAGDPAQATLARITLLSLATHTSGLPRLPGNIGPNPDANPDPYAAYDRAALVAALRAHGAVATPGRKVAYSNFGVAVLGEALGAAWGTSYADALREHVLAPLGMKATTVGFAGAPPPADLAPAHAGGRAVPNWTWLAAAPAGGLRSSARDMAVFLAACLNSSGPLRPALDASMQAQRDDDDTGTKVALGWLLAGNAEHPIFWHNGATGGSHAFVAFDRKAGAGVVILANMQFGPEAEGFRLLGIEPPMPRDRRLSNAADYPGRYPLSPAFVLTITETGGALFLQATGQPRLALRPAGADRFSVVGVDAEVSFERDAKGKVTALTLHQNGRDLRGVRGELPPPPKEVALSAETLAGYAGEYPLAPSFVLTVTVENGALFVQATGQPKHPVFATAKDEFFYKVVDAQLSFQRDDSGAVTGVVLHQNGRDMPAKKVK